MTISLIVAVAENNVIGKDNKLVWYLPADTKYFREKTLGHCVITGRKNYESIPEKFRPLPGRTNIVITHQKDYKAPQAIVVNSIQDALREAEKTEKAECFIIGGAEIYRQTMAMAHKIYLTKIQHHFEGDAYFPEIDPTAWKEIKSTTFKPDEKNKYLYSFIEYKRRDY